MRSWITPVAVAILCASCTAPRSVTSEEVSSAPTVREIDLSTHFRDVDDGCFVLHDVTRGEVLEYRPERCARRLPPCSTFKVPNSMFGLETGVIRDAGHLLEWDGVERERRSLNRDHTLRSAIRNSVVWYYQEIARRVGGDRMQDLLDRIDYGNRDISGGLTTFWLGSSLAISAREQVAFLERLSRDALPLSRRSQRIVQRIMVAGDDGETVHRGKTGSLRADANGAALGWYVGWIARGDDRWIFACNVSGAKAWGPLARSITESILAERGLLPEARPSGR